MEVSRERTVELWMDPKIPQTPPCSQLSLLRTIENLRCLQERLDASSTISLIFSQEKNVYRNGKHPLIPNLPENKVKPDMFPGTPGNYLRTGEAEGYLPVL